MSGEVFLCDFASRGRLLHNYISKICDLPLNWSNSRISLTECIISLIDVNRIFGFGVLWHFY